MELYIHIPFCVRKCAYCSFASFPASEEDKDAYVSLLLREAELRRGEYNDSVETVYIGGGTPSLLSGTQFGRLTDGIRTLFQFTPSAEFSVEANPGTLTKQFLSSAVSAGVNRISLGMQAYQERLLEFLGRIHTFSDVKKSVSLARDAGIKNLNLDLIFGIPGQTVSEWSETLDAALSLLPDHISAYGLIPEEGTPLFHMLETGQASLPDPEEERDMYNLAVQRLHRAGLFQYEISNFARENRECRHNIGYWTQIPYLGLGLSAASMRILEHNQYGLTCLRTTNPSDPVVYREMIFTGDPSRAVSETVLPDESRFESMMLFLRMTRGISDEEFIALHGISPADCFGDKLESMRRKGLILHEKGSWKLSRRGMDIQNSILVEMMEDHSH